MCMFMCFPDMPQNTLPVLVIDGKTTLTQSYAIARYIANELSKYISLFQLLFLKICHRMFTFIGYL